MLKLYFVEGYNNFSKVEKNLGEKKELNDFRMFFDF